MRNNFTKEELENINEDIWTWGDLREKPEYIEIIQNKIKSMIDNYCEHESCYIDTVPINICKDCDEVSGI